MMNRREFLKEALKLTKGQAEQQGHRWHFYLVLLVVLALLIASIVGIAIHVAELAIGAGTAFVAVVVFVYWITFESYYSIYRNEAVRADTATVERDSARERLKPKLKILDETEFDPIERRCRFRVGSLCDVGLKFGAEISRIDGGAPNGMDLPFALRLIPETDERIEFLPAGQTRLVDVAMFTSGPLAFLGIGNSMVYVAHQLYNITIRVYIDGEGKSDEKEFVLIPDNDTLELMVIQPNPPPEMNSPAQEPIAHEDHFGPLALLKELAAFLIAFAWKLIEDARLLKEAHQLTPPHTSHTTEQPAPQSQGQDSRSLPPQ